MGETLFENELSYIKYSWYDREGLISLDVIRDFLADVLGSLYYLSWFRWTDGWLVGV